MSDDPSLYVALKVSAGLTLAVSIVSIGIDIAIYTALESPKIGAFWLSIPSIIASVIAFFVTAPGPTIAVSVFATFAVVMGVVGSVVDGIASSVLMALTACINKSLDVTGSYSSDVALYLTLSAINNNIDDNTVICTQKSMTAGLIYRGTSNGDYILGAYNQLVYVGMIFDVITLGMSFALMCIAYHISCCCRPKGDLAQAAQPVQVIASKA
jgi:hypothetical protein